MFDIIICEDNNYQRQQIETIIKDEIINSNLKCSITLATDKPEFVIKYIEENNYRTFLYFLDVELHGKMNGIELAKIIRNFDSMGYIVFITSHVELTMLTFQYKVQAMDYIVKDDLNNVKSKVIECIREAYNDYKNIKTKKTSDISINVGNNIVYFNLNDILFFETTTKDHKIRIHTCDEQLEFYGTLKEIEKMMSVDYYKSHRSYLVNTKKIKAIDKNKFIIYMINDEVCYISARYLKGLLEKCSI
jgi:two-component system response regulator AgrA